MKNLLALLVMVSIVELSLAQSILNENNISGIWLTGDEKTVLLYQSGNVYNMVGYDLGQRQTTGDILAQYVPLGNSCFQIIGMIKHRNGGIRAIDALGRFDGRSEIKVKGESSLNLDLVRRLGYQELIKAVQSQIPSGNQNMNLLAGSGMQSSGYDPNSNLAMQSYPTQPMAGTGGLPNMGMPDQYAPVSLTQPGQEAIRSPVAQSPTLPGQNYLQPAYPQPGQNYLQPGYPQPGQNVPVGQPMPEAPTDSKEKGKKLWKGVKTAAKIAGGLGIVNIGKLFN